MKNKIPSALEQVGSMISQYMSGRGPVISPLPEGYEPGPPRTPHNLDYASMIRQGYQKLGGATPDLEAQIPVMAEQIKKNPYLYPTYPAIPFAETSLGKNVSKPGNYFNWGVRINPYPLQEHSPGYITERVAYRLTTNPSYAKFRSNPNPQSLQESGYAPVQDNNPYWLKNMIKAIAAFPPVE